jgi:hypothetical protein
MTAPDAVRALFQELLDNTTTVGAYSFGNGQATMPLDFANRLSIVHAECTVELGDVSDTGSPLVLVHAPSAWHALIYLIKENRNFLAGHSIFGQTCLVFRGHSDVSWPLLASLFRPGTDIDTERRVTDAFVNLATRFYFRQIWTNMDGMCHLKFLEDYALVPRALHVATAQHYGIRTPLLDYTTDPAVAIWFACHCGAGAHGKEAVVFALPTAAIASLGMRSLLPHPYIRRIYRQRGVFVQPNKSEGDDLRGLSVEVRFPCDSQYEILRDTGSGDLLGTDTIDDGDRWWMDLVSAARAIVADGGLDALIKFPMNNAGFMGVAEMTGLWDYPEWLMRDNRRRIIMSTLEDLFQALLSITTAFDGQTPHVSTSAVKFLAEENALTLGVMLPALRVYASTMATVAMKHAADELLAVMSKEVEEW